MAEDVHDLGEHLRRMASPDLYRLASCARCGGERMHVHTRPERHPRGESSLPAVVPILQFRCATCRATWRVLPAFLARHLWHTWKAVERTAVDVPSSTPPARSSPPIRPRTAARWRARLASSARLLVVLLATSGGAVLEGIAKEVGLGGARAELVVAYARAASPAAGERLASLGALIHRLERGIRLM